MRGNLVTKIIALVILGIIAFIGFLVAKNFMDSIYAIIVGVLTPIVLVILIGTIFGGSVENSGNALKDKK